MTSELAQPCFGCLQTLTNWAEIIGLSKDDLKIYVEMHPVEPDNDWTIEGRGGTKLRTVHYSCPRCGKGWNSYPRSG